MSSIRLSKVVKDLNVGLSTAVDFLRKKGHAVDSNPNHKISDEEYALLVKEFSTDKDLKQMSERETQMRLEKERMHTHVSNPVTPSTSDAVKKSSLEEKSLHPAEVGKDTQQEEPIHHEDYVSNEKPEEIKIEIDAELLPHIKKVGKIDLDFVNKSSQSKEEANVESEVEPEPTPEPEEQLSEPEVKEPEINEVNEPELVSDISENHPSDNIEIEDPIEKASEEEQSELVEDETKSEYPDHDNIEMEAETDTEPEPVTETSEAVASGEPEAEIFKLHRNIIEPNIKVISKINLKDINQQTRPKKKTKEEKRKEREEKERLQREQQASNSRVSQNNIAPENNNKPSAAPKAGQPDDNKKKEKRKRIHKEKVDIDKTGQGVSHPQRNTDHKPKGEGNFIKRPFKPEVSEEDVQKQIKETLARLTQKKTKGSKYRKERRDSIVARQIERAEQEKDDEKVLKLTEFVTVAELAIMMDVPVTNVIATCMNLGVMVSINQRLDAETINIVADEFGFSTEYVSSEVIEAINQETEEEDESERISRPPIVTVMGHVDHGKTSLLDYIRKSNVIAGEAGGITQHIGAYHVTLEGGRRITFLDTPGHEAFTAMRARGAAVTDIAIIIVAADDSVMPQTIEAIHHASAANVPIVFAINKIDKPGANPEKIKEALANMNYLVEDWGGKYQSQEISAKKGAGIKELLEKVLLEADLLELKANPDKRAIGSTIESSLDKGRGYVATVLVQDGTLHMGDVVLAGTHFGKVKAMFNERNQRVTKAGPSEPVIILGLNGAPQAGDNFNVMPTEQEARDIATKREQLQREQGLRTSRHITLDEIGRRIAIGNFQELNIIVKGDVDGSIEALSDSLIKLSNDEIQVNVIHKAVGPISESDVMLAAASNAIIVGFQVRPSLAARKIAEKEEIDIRLYSIIYNAIEEIKAAMEGMLSPEIQEEIVATVEVREVFKITKVGTVAGCIVKEGKIKRGSKVRLIRDGIVVYTGELGSLKRFKEDVKEVATGYECGLNVANYNDIKIGDIVEGYEEVEVKKTL
ncbi:translation initiation factor IF-2 [Microbacter margulisiae]|uniref:Translation initiation factor IF-2 n=1 Tax=Microbacter margulisiae TaxID=1350067 RepID=A0A7W5DSC2_9PORP|nr:translation initiation factor IF-2 [Microbacter margulisiae]MBB3188172.1 translation initiation factor IF-2 [Microbacter margulisiae]